MQSKTTAGAEADSQARTLLSLQADNHSRQYMNEGVMYAAIMQYVSTPSSSH